MVRFMNEDECMCTGLRQAAFAVTEVYDSYLEPSGLKITMFRVIRRLSGVGEATITELADIVGVDRSTLGRNLRVLEKMNLITFKDGEDGRSKSVVLSEAGKAALAKATPLWLAAQKSMRSKFGKELGPALKALSNVKDIARAAH
jgi:DNA-binding MarR family transcriptional regulator